MVITHNHRQQWTVVIGVDLHIICINIDIDYIKYKIINKYVTICIILYSVSKN